MTALMESSPRGIRFTRREAPPEGRAESRPSRPLVRFPDESRDPLVHLSPAAFHEILQMADDPTVICEERGLFRRSLRYTLQQGGYLFTTTVPEELNMPPGAMLVCAERVQFR